MIRMRIHHQELSQQCWSPVDHLPQQELKMGLQHPVSNKYKISIGGRKKTILDNPISFSVIIFHVGTLIQYSKHSNLCLSCIQYIYIFLSHYIHTIHVISMICWLWMNYEANMPVSGIYLAFKFLAWREMGLILMRKKSQRLLVNYTKMTAIGLLSSLHAHTDRGVCSSTWQLFEQGKASCPLFVTSKVSIPANNTLGWCAVVVCACEISYFFL